MVRGYLAIVPLSPGLQISLSLACHVAGGGHPVGLRAGWGGDIGDWEVCLRRWCPHTPGERLLQAGAFLPLWALG